MSELASGSPAPKAMGAAGAGVNTAINGQRSPALAGVSPADLNKFLSTDQGKKYATDSPEAQAQAFNQWNATIGHTQTNWGNYAALANANQGGEAEGTITEGAAVSQRTQLLGALASSPANPTAGLGVLGARVVRR